MHTPSIRRGQAEGLPLTHAAYFAASSCGEPAPRVQVRKSYPDGPCVFCAEVRELHDRNGQWFKLDTIVGTLWAECRNVRLCSGDGRCTCEPVRLDEDSSC